MTRFLRVTALLLTILVLASVLSSCDWIDRLMLHLEPVTEAPRGIPENDDRSYVSLAWDGVAYSAAYTPVRPRHSYRQLNEDQKALYDVLEKNVCEVYPEKDKKQDLYKTRQAVLEDVLLSTADIRVTAKALYDDNPELFWLSGTIYQLTDEDAGYTAVQMRSVYSPDQIEKMKQQIIRTVNAFYADVPAGLSEYEREKLVHDYIGDICDYDMDTAKTHGVSERVNEAYMIYGVLVKHTAVCEGYARTMQLLLTGLGVDCIGVIGRGYDSSGDSELHMWNAVSVGGDWYYADPTWDDQLSEYRRYQYFNLDSRTMSRDHENSRLLSELTEEEINGDETFSAVAMNLFIPECTATDYQYYIYECPHLRDYDGAQVKESLYRAAQDQEPYFTVYVEPDALDFDEAMTLLFSESPQYFFSYVSEVNGWLSGYEIDNSNMTYYTNRERSAVTVALCYY